MMRGTFWDAGNVLYLDLGGSYLGVCVCVCKNSLSTLKSWAHLCKNITP